MVFYYTCIDPNYIVYMGEDKFENEKLIQYSFPEDIWFHVDKFSSAHVYLRLSLPQQQKLFDGLHEQPEGAKIFEEMDEKYKLKYLESIPDAIVQDLSQWVKENSIQGKKEQAVRIVYTLASNLKKSGDMSIGEVGFHNMKLVKYVNNVSRNREIINRIKKTEVEKKTVDFEKELMEREKRERDLRKKYELDKKQKMENEIEEKRKQKEQFSYDSMFSTENLRPNNNSGMDEDDFI